VGPLVRDDAFGTWGHTARRDSSSAPRSTSPEHPRPLQFPTCSRVSRRLLPCEAVLRTYAGAGWLNSTDAFTSRCRQLEARAAALQTCPMHAPTLRRSSWSVVASYSSTISMPMSSQVVCTCERFLRWIGVHEVSRAQDAAAPRAPAPPMQRPRTHLFATPRHDGGRLASWSVLRRGPPRAVSTVRLEAGTERKRARERRIRSAAERCRVTHGSISGMHRSLFALCSHGKGWESKGWFHHAACSVPGGSSL